jgi:hypothetical protein
MGGVEKKEEAAGGSSRVVDKTESVEEYPMKLAKKKPMKKRERVLRSDKVILPQLYSDFSNFLEDCSELEPTFLATQHSDVQHLSLLLSNANTNVDVTYEKGNTALHHAVLSACLYDDADG